MTQKMTAADDRTLATVKNVIYAFALLRVVSFIGARDGAPLFGFLADPIFITFRWILGPVTLVLWFFRASLFTTFMIVSALVPIFQFCLSYTSVGAFSTAPFFLFIFAALFLNQPNQNAKREAARLVAVVFFVSALQKINGTYLSGTEFFAGSPFMSYIQLWLPQFRWPLPEFTPSLLAYLSIAIELCVALGALLLPSRFANIVALFVLLLALFHPPVLYVYFFFLPLLLLMADGFSPTLVRALGRNGSLPAIAIMLAIKATVFDFADLRTFPFLTYAFTVLLLVFHVGLTMRPRANADEIWNTYTFSFKSFVLPVIVLSTFIGSFFWLPSPLGFNMFSARRFRIPTYNLAVASGEACAFAYAKWSFSLVTDAAIEIRRDGNCSIRFPVKSGLLAIAEEICQKYPATPLELSTRGATNRIECKP
ncbi:hypothetical protein BH10BDE1_BH10BDE1_30790 [soil metagenome]